MMEYGSVLRAGLEELPKGAQSAFVKRRNK